MIEKLKGIVPGWLHPRHTLGPMVLKRTRGRVVDGPFRGMAYPALDYVTKSMHSAYYPKLLGTYERELTDVVKAIIALSPDRIVNVGAGEGYYAVGLAIRCQSAIVIAFEADLLAHPVLKAVAEQNQVLDRIETRGLCDLGGLAAALDKAERPVVICDVEGYEDVLLDMVAIPGLGRCSILVEMHEMTVPGVIARVISRFNLSHNVTAIMEQPRTRIDFPFPTIATQLLPEYYVTFMVREHRKEKMTWLWMTPNSSF